MSVVVGGMNTGVGETVGIGEIVGVNLPLSLGEVVGIVGACNCMHPEELSQEQFLIPI